MDKKILFILPTVFLISLLLLVGKAEAAGEPAFCAINGGLNISNGVNGPSLVGTTAFFNWTVTIGSTSNSSLLNVTNVTFFRNDTRAILCENTTLRINTTTRGNCTLDSTALVDDDALTIVGEAYLANGTGGTERCTNLSFMINVNINNTAPTISGAALNGKLFTGLRGASIDNLSIIVDNATRNCTLTIGNAQGQNQQQNTVITKSANAGNCTFQPTSSLPDGSYWVRWSAFDGLDTRLVDNYYTFQLKPSNNAGQTPIIDIATTVGKTTDANRKRDYLAVAGLILIILFVVFMKKK